MLASLVLLLLAAAAAAQDGQCLDCHRSLVEGKQLHAALSGGCGTCHASLDTSVVPHKGQGTAAKGLREEPPVLCQHCHERKLFERAFTHAPAAAGLCTACHDAHASREAKLMRKAGSTLCLECHADVTKRPHVLAGFSRRGHPLGDDPKSAAARDPLRAGRLFYCGSCHEPHGGPFAHLTRFETKSMTGFCQKCHDM